MIYFTADWHFCHDRDFIYKERGFNSVEEMNEKIVQKFNALVDPDDTIYVLGDCALNDTETAIKYMKRLNGNKFLVIGNHDSEAKIQRYVEENIFKDISFGYRIKASKRQWFFLSHYPSLVSNFDDPTKVYNIHGHTHGKEKFQIEGGKNYCAGLEAHNCWPVSIETILNDINCRKALKCLQIME